MNRRLVGLIGAGWLLFSIWVYTAPLENNRPDHLSAAAVRGKLVWERSGCISCHQLYGLGGFLGPDLTQLMDRTGPNYLKTMVQLGSQLMPKQDLEESEIEDLSHYLTAVSSSGRWPGKRWPPPRFSAK
ncbi:MAG: cytochrome c [Planctomycetota bacterium]|nr:cytochrome c [Planctomycetota bacterium]